MQQPNLAANFGPSLPSEFLSPELGLLIFPQEDPSAYFGVQVGAFEPQPPVVQEFSQFMIPGPPAPGLTGNEMSAGSLTENRFVLGQNFPESPGPPAALPLTAPRGPSEPYEPSQGVLVPRTSEGNFPQAPPERSCSTGVPPGFWESQYNLGFEYADVNSPQVGATPPGGVLRATWYAEA